MAPSVASGDRGRRVPVPRVGAIVSSCCRVGLRYCPSTSLAGVSIACKWVDRPCIQLTKAPVRIRPRRIAVARYTIVASCPVEGNPLSSLTPLPYYVLSRKRFPGLLAVEGEVGEVDVHTEIELYRRPRELLQLLKGVIGPYIRLP